MAIKKVISSSKPDNDQIPQDPGLVEASEVFRESAEFKARIFKTIRMISLIIAGASVAASIFHITLGLLVNSAWFLMLLPVYFWVIVNILVFFYINPTSSKRLRNAAYLIVVGGIITIASSHLLLGTISVMFLAYVLIVILAALLGLQIKEIIGIALVCVALVSSLSLSEKVFKTYTALIKADGEWLFQIIVAAMMIGVIIVGIVVLVQNLYSALAESQQQSWQFLQANQRLTETNQFGKDVTLSLNSIVTELHTSSRQQASGAQEQAAAVMEITTSLTELGETARQIAGNSSRVSSAASDGLYSAERVREATERANTTSERGQVAVDSSIQAIEDVRNGITGLAERLMILTERSKQISSIIAMIKEIADETHLLALNAAIESAGSGENGRRFAVVASEVKSLADRSLEATSEVGQIISELQGAVASAVLASEETRKKTFGAVERSYQAGQVITELGQVVDETASSSIQILESVQQVATLAEEIRLATQQQESAIRQIILTMEGVGVVAQENASTVSQVSETVSRIDQLSNLLKDALESSGLSSAAA